jgi:hypothetical protein
MKTKPIAHGLSFWLPTILACIVSICAAQITLPSISAIPKPPVKAPAVTPPAKPPAIKLPGRLPTPSATPAKPTLGAPSAAPARPATYPPARPEPPRPSLGTPRPGIERERGLSPVPHADPRITHPTGVRRDIRVTRPDGSGVFAGRGGHGYVQHPYLYGHRQYIQRTYYAHGAAYSRFYRPYTYHGASLAVYTPVRYYSPAFYGWAYNSRSAIPYGASPGIPFAVYYASYFSPAAIEPGAPYWLADYMISANLAEAYQAQLDAANITVLPPLDGTYAPVTPAVKELIAEEVQRQLSRENAEAQQVAANADPDPALSGLGRMLDNTSHAFVAGADLDVLDNLGRQCALSPGDVIQLATPAAETADTATLVVLATKPQECPKGALISVRLADLQDMQNRMRETVDDGLAAIQANAGQNGWPALPQSAASTGTPAPFAAIAPPPDPNAASEIAGAEQQPQDDPLASLTSRVMQFMENPPNQSWMTSLAVPRYQIRTLGVDGYIRQNGGIAAVMASTQRDLATLQRTNGMKDSYGIALNQAWIDLLEFMFRQGQYK